MAKKPLITDHSVIQELTVAVNALQHESRERHSQVERVVNKLDEYVGKVQELNVLTNQFLARSEVQLENLHQRVDETQKDIDGQSQRLDQMQVQFIEAMEKFADRISLTNRELMTTAQTQAEKIQSALQSDTNELRVRVRKLEEWRFYLLGGAAVAGVIVTMVGNIASNFLKDWALKFLHTL